MLKQIEGSQAVADVVALCRPNVIAAYPITPQTHIVEDLAEIVSEGRLKAEFVNVESEFAAASVVLGASASGARTYTATTSQGMLLMNEVIYCIAGMRLPIVLTCANRAIAAPLNIWNDHQDSMSVRDAGWIPDGLSLQGHHIIPFSQTQVIGKCHGKIPVIILPGPSC